ncbi:MAG: hypothetical protein ACRC0Q_06950 [Kurthia gibsonii]
MIYLKDTCVFINKLNPTSILDIMNLLKQRKEYLGVTNVILNELIPGKSIPMDDAEKSQSILTSLGFVKNSKNFIEYDVEKEEEFSKNFKRIRRRFYGHLSNLESVRKALINGEISKESFDNRTYLNKDCGECSCIAVAITNPEEFVIVSDDKGRVFLKPDINLFDKYKESHKIQVLNYDEWHKEIYTEVKQAN